jgi:hypothetical protein
MRRSLLVAVALLLGVACSTNTKDSGVPATSAPESAIVSSPTEVLPTPTRPPKVNEGRLEGRYKVNFVQLSSTFGGTAKPPPARWVFTPRCENRPCSTKMESKSGDYNMVFAYIHGRYRGVVSQKITTGQCAPYTLRFQYTLIPTKAAYIHGDWVATTFKGSNVETATGGSCLPATEHDALKGIRG